MHIDKDGLDTGSCKVCNDFTIQLSTILTFLCRLKMILYTYFRRFSNLIFFKTSNLN